MPASRSMSNLRLQVKIQGSVVNTLEDGVAPSGPHPALVYTPSLANGIDANQANRGYQVVTRSLAAGATETLDLYDFGGIDIEAGAGNDATGQAVIHEEVVAIAVLNNNAVTAAGLLEITPAASNGWAPIGSHTVGSNGMLRGQGLLFMAQVASPAFVVTDASSHRVTFAAVTAAVTYSIYLFARYDEEVSSSSSSWSSPSVSWSSSSSSRSVSSSSWSSRSRD